MFTRVSSPPPPPGVPHLPSPAPQEGSDLHSSLPTWADPRALQGPWGSSFLRGAELLRAQAARKDLRSPAASTLRPSSASVFTGNSSSRYILCWRWAATLRYLLRFPDFLNRFF